uniref:Ig-like domain-containing protein n=1 Tax=Oreochromis niloticus TaxID=8128 RepID=I3JKQ4_ORENI
LSLLLMIFPLGLKQKPTVMIPTLTEGQQATLTCTAPGLCSGSNLTTFRQRHSSTLTFNPSAEHHNTNVTCKIHFTGETTTEKTSGLNVNYKGKPQIIGNKTVKEGDDLNLTCSIESFPPALTVWKKLGSYVNLHNDTGSATLVIYNVTTEHSGQYICAAKYLNTTVTSEVNVTVTCK